MINNEKALQNIESSISNKNNNKLESKNIIKNNNVAAPYYNKVIKLIKNINNNSLIPQNNNKKNINSAKIRNLENKSISVGLNPINLNKININHNKVFLHLTKNFSKKNIFSSRIKRPKIILIKNKSSNSENNILPKLELKRKNMINNRIYYLGGDFSFNNKYISDLLSENNIENKNNKEKTDMETADIKIEKLAKDINLYQNERKYRNFSINSNSQIKNNFFDDEYKNSLPIINSDNSSNKYSDSQSRISSGIPGTRLYSSKMTNNIKIYGSNKYLYKKKLSRLLSPSFLSDRYNIVGTNIMSPICQKARDIFLYKKIFYYFNGKKTPKIMQKFINNKLNICYAENEKQFDKKIILINEDNSRKGKARYHKVGKAETEKRAASLQHRVEFIKKIFDYAYPDILICRIKNKCEMDKREIKENYRKIQLKKRELEQKSRIKKYKKSLLHDSIIINKLE